MRLAGHQLASFVLAMLLLHRADVVGGVGVGVSAVKGGLWSELAQPWASAFPPSHLVLGAGSVQRTKPGPVSKALTWLELA